MSVSSVPPCGPDLVGIRRRRVWEWLTLNGLWNVALTQSV